VAGVGVDVRWDPHVWFQVFKKSDVSFMENVWMDQRRFSFLFRFFISKMCVVEKTNERQ